MHRKKGFTLIEMSIVLVIIGLLIGGILVGRDLIGAAQIRQQISQIEQFDTAVNNFKLKYNCLPGDCANASDFGFGTVHASFPINGDGNGMVDCLTACLTNYEINGGGESLNFWKHLVQASLIPAVECDTVDLFSTIGCGYGRIEGMYPRPKLTWQPGIYNGNGGIALLSTAIFNANSSGQQIVPFAHVYYFGSCICTEPGILRINDIHKIDIKIDDGMPMTGIVESKNANGGFNVSTPGWILTTMNGGLDIAATPPVYVNDASNNNSVMIVRASF